MKTDVPIVHRDHTAVIDALKRTLSLQKLPPKLVGRGSRFTEHLSEDDLLGLEHICYLTAPEDAALVRAHLLKSNSADERSRSPHPSSPWNLIRRISRSSKRRIPSDALPDAYNQARHSEDVLAPRRSNRDTVIWDRETKRPPAPIRSLSSGHVFKGYLWQGAKSPDVLSFRRRKESTERSRSEEDVDPLEPEPEPSSPGETNTSSGYLRNASSFTDSSILESSSIGLEGKDGSSFTTGATHKRDLSRISENMDYLVMSDASDLHVPRRAQLGLIRRQRMYSCSGVDDITKRGEGNTEFVIGRSNSKIISKPQVTTIHFPSDSDPALPLPSATLPQSPPLRIRSLSTPAPSLLSRLRPREPMTPPAPPPSTPFKCKESTPSSPADGRPLLPLAARDLWDRAQAQGKPVHRRAETKLDMLIHSPDSKHLKNYFGNKDKQYLEIEIEQPPAEKNSPSSFQGGWGKAGVDKFLEKNGLTES